MKPYEHFIEHVHRTMEENNGKCEFVCDKYVKYDDTYSSGWFDGNDGSPIIKVAVGKPILKWLSILVHEYSHFEQYKSKCKHWRMCDLPNEEDALTKLDEWIHGEEMDITLVKECIKRARNLELDCERRAIANIKKFKLPIDVNNYCQQANAYVHFYNYILIVRKWYKKGKEPTVIDEIVSEMPTNLDGRYDRTPKKYIKLFDQYCGLR